MLWNQSFGFDEALLSCDEDVLSGGKENNNNNKNKYDIFGQKNYSNKIFIERGTGMNNKNVRKSYNLRTKFACFNQQKPSFFARDSIFFFILSERSRKNLSFNEIDKEAKIAFNSSLLVFW